MIIKINDELEKEIDIKKSLSKGLEKVKKFKKPIIILTIIYIFAMIAIIRADFNYIDDNGRIYEGYKGWEDYGRYTSNILSTLIHGDNYLTDVSPLAQIIAAVILAISSVMLIYVITDKEKITFWNIIAVIPLGLSPYFLECLSYKYDAPYIALSIFASVLPFLFKNHNKYVYIMISIIGTLLMCTTYQASSGIFLMILILLCLKEWNKGKKIKDILKFLIKSTVGFIIGLLIFKIFILSTSRGAYRTYEILPINQIILNTIKNIYQYYTYVFSDFKITWIILIGVSLVAFPYKALKETKNKKYITLILSICSLFLMAILCFGVYPALKNPPLTPRAMYGFGVFIAIIQIYSINLNKRYFQKIACLILAWLFIVFSFTYGNALSAQKQYTYFRVSIVLNDLNELDIFNNEEIKYIKIIGDIGKTPIIKNMPNNYNILDRLIPRTFCGSWHWGKYYFYNYFGLKNVIWNDKINENSSDMLIIKDTMYHTIKSYENNVVIILK